MNQGISRPHLPESQPLIVGRHEQRHTRIGRGVVQVDDQILRRESKGLVKGNIYIYIILYIYIYIYIIYIYILLYVYIYIIIYIYGVYIN